MKIKHSNTKEWNQAIKPEEEVTFGLTSPFKSITFPKNTIIGAWHGKEFSSIAVVGSVLGTAYVVRSDIKDLKPINVDIYTTILLEDRKTLLISGPEKPEYHHIGDEKGLPKYIKDKISQETINKIRDYLKNQKNLPVSKKAKI